jgi:O-antigen/teichoic acid export membrane protein
MARPGPLLRDKFSRDVLWNVVSLGVAGVCGVLVNYLLGAIYGAAVLGVFNQVFAVYIVCSQLAALGIHSSVLAHVAMGRDTLELRAILVAALLLTCASALAVCALFVGVAHPVAGFLASPDVAVGILWAAPGLFCFSLNKVILAMLNGLRRMRAYAVFQAGRVVLLGAGLAACGVLDVRPTTLPVILSISEVATLLLSIGTVADHLGKPVRGELVRWARIHLHFGVRGFLWGLFFELNNRIDVIILGRFVSDAMVGAYSLAALVAEGVSQILVALRTNYAPVMVRLLAEGKLDELARAVRKGRNRVYLAALVLGPLAMAGYWLVLHVASTDAELEHSTVYFVVLIAGWMACSGYVPFNGMLLWARQPGWNTIMTFTIVVVSVLADLILVSLAGTMGAACATALTLAVAALLLRVFVARRLGARI